MSSPPVDTPSTRHKPRQTTDLPHKPHGPNNKRPNGNGPSNQKASNSSTAGKRAVSGKRKSKTAVDTDNGEREDVSDNRLSNLAANSRKRSGTGSSRTELSKTRRVGMVEDEDIDGGLPKSPSGTVYPRRARRTSLEEVEDSEADTTPPPSPKQYPRSRKEGEAICASTSKKPTGLHAKDNTNTIREGSSRRTTTGKSKPAPNKTLGEDDVTREPTPMDDEVANLLKAREQVSTNMKDAEMAERLKSMQIGCAFIRGCGPGVLYDIFDFDTPLVRVNPRPINPYHANRLYVDVFVKGRKHDHKSAITFECSRSSLPDDLLEAMQAGNASDPTFKPPRLRLVHENMARIDEIVCMTWLGKLKDGSPMDEETRNELVIELNRLRSTLPLVRMLNGNHRATVVMQEGQRLAREHRSLSAIQATRPLTAEESERLAEINHLVLNLTWRCDVYDMDMLNKDPEARQRLTRNEDPLNQMGMGPGEHIWSTVNQLLLWDKEVLDKAHSDGRVVTRTAMYNQVHTKWLDSDLSKQMNIGASAAAAAAESALKARSGNRSRSAQAVDPTKNIVSGAVDELAKPNPDLILGPTLTKCFDEPLTQLLMRDTQYLSDAWNQVMSNKAAEKMLGPWGANLAARVWLALRTLSKLYTVTEGEGVNAAEAFVSSHPITADGYEEAAPVLTRLQDESCRDASSPLLSLFTRAESTRFGKLYVAKVAPLVHPRRGILFDSDEYKLAMRELFDEFARGLPNLLSSRSRSLRASMQTYARLSTAPGGIHATEGEFFYPAALLPATEWMTSIANSWTTSQLTDEALAIFDILLDQHCLLWTRGTTPSPRAFNIGRCFERASGPARIVLGCLDREGSIYARLSQAIFWLEDTRALHGFKAVSTHTGESLDEIEKDCCTPRSAQASSPYAETLMAQTTWKPVKDFRTSFSAERTSAKNKLHENHGEGFADYVATLPILSHIVKKGYWLNANLWEWVSGWRSSSITEAGISKNMPTFNSGCGWGMVGPRFVSSVLQPVLKQPKIGGKAAPARHLLRMACDLLALDDEECWLSGRLGQAYPDYPPAPPTGPAASKDLEVTKPPKKRRKKGDAPDAIDEKTKPGTVPLKSLGATQTRGSTRTKTPAAAKAPPKSAPMIESDDENPVPPFIPDPPAAHPNPVPRAQLAQASADVSGPKKPGPPSARGDNPNHVSIRPESVSHVVPKFPGVNSIIKGAPAPGETRDWELRALDHDAAVRIRHCQPGHVFARPYVSGVFFHNFDGFLRRRNLPMPFSLLTYGWDGRGTVDAMTSTELVVLRNVEALRVKFRISLQKLCQAVADMPLGRDFAETALAPAVAALKDIFLARVAEAIQGDRKCKDVAAISKAVLMGGTDGLFAAELVKVVEGCLILDCTTTFPKEMQSKVVELVSPEEMGPLQGSDDEGAIRLRQLMEYFLPVRGYGSTERESRNRGVVGALAMRARQELAVQSPHLSVYVVPSKRVVDLENAPWDHNLDSISYAIESMSDGVLTRESIAYPTARSQSSPWSTGSFCVWPVYIPASPMDGSLVHGKEPPTSLAPYILHGHNILRKAWTKSVEISLLNYRIDRGLVNSPPFVDIDAGRIEDDVPEHEMEDGDQGSQQGGHQDHESDPWAGSDAGDPPKPPQASNERRGNRSIDTPSPGPADVAKKQVGPDVEEEEEEEEEEEDEVEDTVKGSARRGKNSLNRKRSNSDDSEGFTQAPPSDGV